MTAEVDPEVLRAAIGSCVTVLQPDEVLAVLVPGGLEEAECARMAEEAETVHELYGVRIVFVCGEDFAVAKTAAAGGGTGGPGGT